MAAASRVAKMHVEAIGMRGFWGCSFMRELLKCAGCKTNAPLSSTWCGTVKLATARDGNFFLMPSDELLERRESDLIPGIPGK
jgi:hypothetical protein